MEWLDNFKQSCVHPGVKFEYFVFDLFFFVNIIGYRIFKSQKTKGSKASCWTFDINYYQSS